jgi:hypothetical protein
LHVESVEDSDIAPPLRWCRARDIQAQHDEDGGDEEAGVERCGRDVVLSYASVYIILA